MSWLAPCGHRGQPVIGAFVLCLAGCDGIRTCPRCSSREVEPFHAPMLPEESWRCLPCGRVWSAGYS